MANVQPLRREDLPQYEDLFKIYEQQMGFVRSGPPVRLILSSNP
jgi:hypothetical protein